MNAPTPFSDAIGRSETRIDTLTRFKVDALRALLDLEANGEAPPAIHWTMFASPSRPDELGRDGHPVHGGFLPALPLPRRMWAGGEIEFISPIGLGRPLTRITRIADVAQKTGRSGPLIFLTLDHAVSDGDVPILAERQSLVFRETQSSRQGIDGAVDDEKPWWSTERRTDPRILFMYSALCYNAHRIHYDEPYARTVEGYPGLVVHGPLIATLLMSAIGRACPGRNLRRFRFRALSPVFEGEALTLAIAPPEGDRLALRALGPERRVAMVAEARLD